MSQRVWTAGATSVSSAYPKVCRQSCSSADFLVVMRIPGCLPKRALGGAWLGMPYCVFLGIIFPNGTKNNIHHVLLPSAQQETLVSLEQRRCVVSLEQRKIGIEQHQEENIGGNNTITREELFVGGDRTSARNSKFDLIKLHLFSTASPSRTQSRAKPYIRFSGVGQTKNWASG